MTGDIITFEKMMNEGYSAAWDKHWERASGFYRQALEEFPDHPQGLTNLGLALFELHAYEEALVHFQRAVEAAPDDPLPHEKIARIYEHLGRVPDAIDKSIASAELHLKTHNIKKAIENWQHAVSLQPENLDLRARLATVYQRMGRKDDAIAEYLVCASLLQHSGEIAKAMQMVDYVLQFYPESKDALQARSMLRAHQPLPKPARLRG
ncbi:MAG: tetratricopeptide repeat protein, partial [Anaerolineaceae bacterium]|nr:tetratricopeptide repeat protein [Anaerolineaceae bacterium]